MIYLLKSKPRVFGLISFYTFYCIFSDLVLTKVSLKYLGSELYAYRLFTIIEYISLTAFVYSLVVSKSIKKIILVGSLVFISISILDIYTSSFKSFDSLPSGVESILILSYTIFFIYERFSSPSFTLDGFVWIGIGLILFFSGTFFLFILSQNNFNDSTFLVTYGYIVASFNIIKNLFFSLGILSYFKKNTTTSPKLQKA